MLTCENICLLPPILISVQPLYATMVTTGTVHDEAMADLALDDAGSSWIDTFSALDPKVRRENATSSDCIRMNAAHYRSHHHRSFIYSFFRRFFTAFSLNKYERTVVSLESVVRRL